MVGIGPAEMLIVMLIGGGLLGVPLGVPPLPLNDTILHAAPEQCLFFAYSAGIAPADAKSGNQTEQLLAEPELREFVSQIGAQIQSALEQAGKQGPDVNRITEKLPTEARLLLTRPVGVYVSRFVAPAGNNPPDVTAALIIHCGPQIKEARQLVKDLEAAALAEGAPPEKLHTVKIEGVSFRQVTDDDAPTVSWGFKDDYLIVAVGSDAPKELLDRIKTPGEPPAWLADLKKQTAIPRPSVIGYLNVAGLIAVARPTFPNEQQANAVLAALGLDNLQFLGTVTGLSKTDLVSRGIVRTEGPPHGLLELVSDKPLALADLKNVPRDSTLAGVLRLDLQQVYHRVMEEVGKIDPASVEEFETNMAGLEQSLGFEFDKGLLASLGDLWTLFDSPAGGASQMTGVGITATLRDHDTFEQIHQRLVGILQQRASIPGALPFTVRESKLLGLTVYQAVPQGFVPISPAWCVTKDRLVIAATMQTLKTHLARDEKSDSLADVPEVAAQFAAHPPAAFMYQDSKAQLRALYPLIEMYSPMVVGGLAQQGIQVQMPALPNLDKLDPHIKPMVGAIRRTKQGLVYERHQTLPIGGNEAVVAPVLVGLLLPAVQAARTAARRNQSTNNLKYLGLAMHNYNDVYKHFPAEAICDKNGKPLLSWRVAVLPYVEENELYKQFHLDEPWDSEHNRPLADKIPSVFVKPEAANLGNKTVYVVPAGKDTLFPKPDKGLKIAEITDGTSNTIMILETSPDHAVEWTKPEDLKVDFKDPLDGLKNTNVGGVFIAAFCDGSVRSISETIDPDVLKKLFTPAGGEVIKPDDF